jgi:hypothetical protein
MPTTATKTMPPREQLVHDLTATWGQPLVDALAERGLMDYLEHHRARLTATQIARQLQRLPPAVIRRARRHAVRRQQDGAAHRCADCAVR